jgi:hypothetical protein
MNMGKQTWVYFGIWEEDRQFIDVESNCVNSSTDAVDGTSLWSLSSPSDNRSQLVDRHLRAMTVRISISAEKASELPHKSVAYPPISRVGMGRPKMTAREAFAHEFLPFAKEIAFWKHLRL